MPPHISYGGENHFLEQAKLYVDRVQAIAWKQAKDAGASFINRKWVAQRLGRTPGWVAANWNLSLGRYPPS